MEAFKLIMQVRRVPQEAMEDSGSKETALRTRVNLFLLILALLVDLAL